MGRIRDPLAVRHRPEPVRRLWTVLAHVLIDLVVFVIARLYARPDDDLSVLIALPRRA